MDITIAYMPDAYMPNYAPLARDLVGMGLAIEILLLKPVEPETTSGADAYIIPVNDAADIKVRSIAWGAENGNRYLAHYYAAVYSQAPAVLVIGPGSQPDSDTVAAMHELINLGYHVVIASRHHKLSRLNYPLIRWLISKSYNRLASLAFRTNTTDVTSGLKLYSKETLIASLGASTTKELTFQLELIRRARKHGAKVAEVPVVIDYQDSPYAVSASDIAKTAIETFRLWWPFR